MTWYVIPNKIICWKRSHFCLLPWESVEKKTFLEEVKLEKCAVSQSNFVSFLSVKTMTQHASTYRQTWIHIPTQIRCIYGQTDCGWFYHNTWKEICRNVFLTGNPIYEAIVLLLLRSYTPTLHVPCLYVVIYYMAVAWLKGLLNFFFVAKLMLSSLLWLFANYFFKEGYFLFPLVYQN